MTTEMKIKAIAPWFGGKRNLAPRIVEQLGPHRYYCEPFCGGISVLLAKNPAGIEVVNDLHGEVTNLARVIQSDQAYDLYERLARTSFCEGLYQDCRQRWIEGGLEDPVDRAYDFFVVSWMGRNGMSGTQRSKYPFQMVKRFSPNGGDGAVRFRNAIDSLPAWHQRLRKVTIFNMDGLELLNNLHDEPRVVVYADPPYLMSGQRDSKTHYEHEFGQGDFFGDGLDDHARLAQTLNRFDDVRVIVSYYNEPRLDELYPPDKWEKMIIPVDKVIGYSTRSGREVRKAEEVLLINGPIFEKAAV